MFIVEPPSPPSHPLIKGRYCTFVPSYRVRARAMVKLSAAVLHDESSITKGGVRKCNSVYKKGAGGGGGEGPSKNWVTWVRAPQNPLRESGDKPGGGRVDVEMGELPLFYFLYSSITFTLCEGKVRFPCFITFWIFSLSIELAMQDSHPTLYCTNTWYHLSISDPFWWSTKNVDCFI